MGLTREQRKRIIKILESHDKMTKAELIEFIRPHYTADYQKLVAQDLGRIANRISAVIRDEYGARKVFAIESVGERQVINVEQSDSISDVKKVMDTLIKKRDGWKYSIAKTRQRHAELRGQTALEFTEFQ